MEKIDNLDICVVTYNRLEYLKNCIWSIIASTSVKYRLVVLSDNSTDGTNEWLEEMKSRGKIDEVIINTENLGSANSFNKVINSTNSDWFVMACDDMWFHRGWDKAAISLVNEYPDCGISNFWNYPYNIDPHSRNCKVLNDHSYRVQATGLAGNMIKRELFMKTGGFFLPHGIKMGLFAGHFCIKSSKTKLKRSKQYGIIPFYAEQMDRNNPGDTKKEKPKLSQEYLYMDYNKRRGIEKMKHKNSKK